MSRSLHRDRWAAFMVTSQTLVRWHRELVRRKWTYGQPTLALAAVAVTSVISLTLRLWIIRRSVPDPR